MPILSAGRASSRPDRRQAPDSGRRGVTLVELLIVMAIIGLLTGVSFPAISSGLDSIRLTSASDSLVSFLNGALNRAERRQQAIGLIILPAESRLELYSNEPGFERHLRMPDGVTIEAVLPRIPGEADNGPRRLIVLPGGSAPGIGIRIANRRGSRRIVRLDPMTGFPRVEKLEQP
jgi:prepilin-type N-terminal cleavage/methylation domain-containing protein